MNELVVKSSEVGHSLVSFRPFLPGVRGVEGVGSSVVRESEFKPKDPGFHPLAGRVEASFLCPPRVHSCADPLVSDPGFKPNVIDLNPIQQNKLNIL